METPMGVQFELCIYESVSFCRTRTRSALIVRHQKFEHRQPCAATLECALTKLGGLLVLLLGARTLLDAPGIATSNKKLLGAEGYLRVSLNRE